MPQNKKVRKLFKVGRNASYGLTLPIDAIRLFGWQEKQKLEQMSMFAQSVDTLQKRKNMKIL